MDRTALHSQSGMQPWSDNKVTTSLLKNIQDFLNVMVEPIGIEPMTSYLRSKRSPG